MNDVADFASSSPGFYRKTAVDQILTLAWYLEARQNRPYFDGAAMRRCFAEVGVDPPDMSVYLQRLAGKKPPQLVRKDGGYRLAGGVRRDLDVRLGGDPTVVAVTRTLIELPARVPDIAEREFLTEALNCYRVRAYRAAIIMAWNLAYDHLVRWALDNPARVKSLNDGLTSRYPKKALTVAKYEDLDGLKESEFIEASRTGNLIDKNTAQILKDKLGRRNMAAHPSRVTITQHQADDMVTDLVENVILRLK